MKNIRKFLSAILAVLIIFSSSAVTAFASEPLTLKVHTRIDEESPSIIWVDIYLENVHDFSYSGGFLEFDSE